MHRSRELGYAGVRMSTMDRMTSAHRVYERLGFARAPEDDWSPVPGVALLAYAAPLVPPTTLRLSHARHEPLGVDDDAGHLAGADQLAVLPGGDAEPDQPAVDVDDARGDLAPSAPTAEGARCSSEIRVPTLVCPSSRAGAIAAQVAASHHASSRGVPRTGRLPDPTRRGGVVLADGALERGGQAGLEPRGLTRVGSPRRSRCARRPPRR